MMKGKKNKLIFQKFNSDKKKKSKKIFLSRQSSVIKRPF